MNVLEMLCTAVVLFALAVYTTAKLAGKAIDRLGLDLLSILLWLGLAERPLPPGTGRSSRH